MTNEADVAARMVAALTETARREGAAALVSFSMEIVAPLADGQARVEVSRKTRTLLFLRADYVGSDGARIATASSVHAVKGEI